MELTFSPASGYKRRGKIYGQPDCYLTNVVHSMDRTSISSESGVSTFPSADKNRKFNARRIRRLVDGKFRDKYFVVGNAGSKGN